MSNEKFVTIKEAAHLLGCSRTLVYRAIAEGRLHPEPPNPLYKGRGPVKIPRFEIDAILAAQRPQP
jgi:excisionase family DNA binding protein